MRQPAGRARTHLAGPQGLAQIKRADHPIFRGSNRKLDQLGWAGPRHRMIMRPAGQVGSGSSGSQLKRQPSTTLMLGITSASARTMVVFAVPFAAYQDAADLWRHSGQDQRERHVIGTDDGGERKRPHLTPFLRVSTPAACWVGPVYAGCERTSHGRRPDFPGVLLGDQLPESQWRDRSGLAPDSSAVAVPMMSHLAVALDP